LEFSGGGDSTTALYSFINNGIELDEVVFRYPKTGEKNVANDPFNCKPENTLSEAQFAAYPILNWLSTVAPRTKITVHDYTENMLTGQYDESWVFKTKDYLPYTLL
jgi:diphthamide synthase (EF-2-diphthine--ammonia ligase)